MEPDPWEHYRAAAASQIGGAILQILAESKADARVTEYHDDSTLCGFRVEPKAEGAALFDVRVRHVDGDIAVGRSVLTFDWFDIESAAEEITRVFEAVVAGRVIESRPFFRCHGRVTLLDGSVVESPGGRALPRTLRWRSARTYAPYARAPRGALPTA